MKNESHAKAVAEIEKTVSDLMAGEPRASYTSDERWHKLQTRRADLAGQLISVRGIEANALGVPSFSPSRSWRAPTAEVERRYADDPTFRNYKMVLDAINKIENPPRLCGMDAVGSVNLTPGSVNWVEGKWL